MKSIIFKAESRGSADYGWLKTNYSFSFADYYNADRMQFGKLRVINDDWIAGGSGFGKHPHENMEIVTIMLEGELRHGDSMGHTQVLHENEVQVMSAGAGIYHSEFNNLPDTPVRLLQIWVLPKNKNIPPRYNQKMFDPQKRINQWQLLVSPNPVAGDLEIKQEAWFSITSLKKDDTIDYTLNNPKHGIYLFILSGSVGFGNELQLEKRDGAGIWDIQSLTLHSNQDSEILLMEVPV